ncbi:hypothetical protein [Sphingobium sp. EM0848]|uniref:hypothetical protein n=1 Tax=Sphingobium sp. EM0848 TaxID=2743473 RepID=UPI00159C544C|nr:hypothetical protein [Sphingobium sp. EM0848]
MLHLKTAKLARWQIRLLCWSGGLLWGTGAAWLILHNFFQIEGEFGPEANPAEPWLLRMHGAAMLVTILALGSLLVVHVWRGWTYRSQRLLGGVMTALSTILILTGYLLYYLTEDGLRGNAALIHWLLGIMALPLFVLHYRQGKRIQKS